LVVLAGVAALMAVANAASSSRTGFLQMGVLLVWAWTWGWLIDKNARVVFLVACLAYSAAAVLLPRLVGLDPSSSGILVRLQDGAPACASRMTLWSNVLLLIEARPWKGWGWGELDYAHFMAAYPGPRFCDILDNAHNLPLHLAVELGLPAALSTCGAVAWLILRGRPWRETSPVRQMAWAVLSLILVHSMVEYPLWYGPFQSAVVLSIWILWRTSPLPHRDWVGTRAAVTAVAILLLASAAYAAWDYRRVSQLYLATSQRAPAYRDNTFEKVRDTWLFARQVRFAELTTTELTLENAAHVNALAHDLLHFSPEARVVEKLIESAALLGRDDEVAAYLTRYQAAFPVAHAAWVKAQVRP